MRSADNQDAKYQVIDNRTVIAHGNLNLCGPRHAENSRWLYAEKHQQNTESNEIAQSRWKEGCNEDFNEPEKEAPRKRAAYFTYSAQHGGDERLPADDRPHVRIEDRIGSGEKDPGKGRHRRTNNKGEDDHRVHRNAISGTAILS